MNTYEYPIHTRYMYLIINGQIVLVRASRNLKSRFPRPTAGRLFAARCASGAARVIDCHRRLVVRCVPWSLSVRASQRLCRISLARRRVCPRLRSSRFILPLNYRLVRTNGEKLGCPIPSFVCGISCHSERVLLYDYRRCAIASRTVDISCDVLTSIRPLCSHSHRTLPRRGHVYSNRRFTRPNPPVVNNTSEFTVKMSTGCCNRCGPCSRRRRDRAIDQTTSGYGSGWVNSLFHRSRQLPIILCIKCITSYA